MAQETTSYWSVVWQQFKKRRLGLIALIVFSLFLIVGLYAPFFASSKPLLIVYEGKIYFPLFRYLFYKGFYTKNIDIFYNLLMFTLPLTLIGVVLVKEKHKFFVFLLGCCLQFFFFFLLIFFPIKTPASSIENQPTVKSDLNDPLLTPIKSFYDFSFDLKNLSPHAKLNLILRQHIRKKEHLKMAHYGEKYEEEYHTPIPTLYGVDKRNEEKQLESYQRYLEEHKKAFAQAKQLLPSLTEAYLPYSHKVTLAMQKLKFAEKQFQAYGEENTHRGREVQAHLAEAQKNLEETLKRSSKARTELIETRQVIQGYLDTEAKIAYYEEKKRWLEEQEGKISLIVMPFLRPFHWEDDAGGGQAINHYLPWWKLTRVNRKDLSAALIFGVRISLVVGVTAVLLSLFIGIPVGTIAGYFAGATDIVIFRLIEIWEAMPIFFMLLLIIALTQSKSIFLVIAVLGVFGWTGFGRFIRGEVLKQRSLPYVLAAKNMGYTNSNIMFSHILPNAIPPILTLLPFSMMGAITSEAALSFLGLGEEGSSSWGVLMDEGRSVFPGESYLLWPPAILLTILLISIALIGDTLRDALDPRLRK